jgi:phosphoglycolate phosphatase-like HAD superfamily hydrolase
MQGARLASTRAVGVLTGAHSRSELLDAGAHTVINDLSELTIAVLAGG